MRMEAHRLLAEFNREGGTAKLAAALHASTATQTRKRLPATASHTVEERLRPLAADSF